MILEAVNIHKSYRQSGNSFHILKGIDLKVKAGEVIAIVGPSGAGKSTLLHILGGLDRPDKGAVTIDGDDLSTIKDHERAKIRNKHVGFVFQFYHLLPEFTALENVVLPAMIKEDHSNVKKFEQQGKNVLEQVGLKDRMTHKPNQLSGGEQQRVAIARALMNKPKIIFCDEPTGNLDSKTSHDIIELLMNLNRNNEQTLIVVTHDESIAGLAHRKASMRDGVFESIQQK